MRKRLFTTVMALCMALSLVPATAFAEVPAPADSLPVEQAAEQPVEETAPAEVPAETPAETEVPAEAPTETAAPEATPAETEAPAEEPAAAETPIEEPTETETPAETPAEPAEPAETPAVTEAPAEEPAAVQAQAETADPEVLSMEVTYNGTNIATGNNGSFWLDAANDTKASDYQVTLTLSDGAAFTPTDHTEGDVYVAEATADSVKLRFDLTVDVVDIDNDSFALYLTSTDGITWTGNFAQAGDLTVETLGYYLSQQTLTLPAGSLGSGSAAQTLVVNQDADSSMLILCAPGAAVYNVNYVYGGNTLTWKLLAGMTIPDISVEMPTGSTLDGWYTDADFTTELTGTVTGDTTIYGKVTTESTTGDFLTELESGANVTIDSMDDWNVFVQNSSVVQAGQVITLGMNIDCDGATYDSMTFAGSFNGAGFTISDANFRAVTTSSGDTCSGMFAKIGPGQVVANLTLQNVTAQYSGTYAGVLVGMADGYNSDHAIIQNVQVRNSSASGRSAGGVAGFIRNATVRYCSSRDTTITGLANGGGIVGLSNAKVEYCYSTTSPTALPSFLGGSAGGVVGKNVRGAYTEYCWATMTVVGGGGEGPGTDVSPLVVSATTMPSAFTAAGFVQNCWAISLGTATDFNYSNIQYPFTENT